MEDDRDGSKLCLPCASAAPTATESTPPVSATIEAPRLGSKRASSRKNRVHVLRSFLVDTYSDYLPPGSTVLDVAGGKGDLSWILSNADGLNPIVCDPRIAKHTHLVKSVDYLLNHPEEAVLRSKPGLDTHQPLAALIPELKRKYGNNGACFVEPGHLRIHVDSDLVDAVSVALEQLGNRGRDVEIAPPSWISYWNAASRRAEGAQPLGYRECAKDSPRRILDPNCALRAILGTKIVVGFHPDQATEACIDLALTLRVPFVVVPCCAFPSEFPDRRTKDNTRVRTYHELVEYLCQKVPFARSEILKFHEVSNARNIILFTLPKDVPAYPR